MENFFKLQTTLEPRACSVIDHSDESKKKVLVLKAQKNRKIRFSV
jgi:hypothetical protein